MFISGKRAPPKNGLVWAGDVAVASDETLSLVGEVHETWMHHVWIVHSFSFGVIGCQPGFNSTSWKDNPSLHPNLCLPGELHFLWEPMERPQSNQQCDLACQLLN